MIYINAIASNYTLRHEIKELIPNSLLRRRMSDIIKQSVAVGIECLESNPCNLDAIITSTGFGCLSDSEKFLENIISNNEQLLSPTPFIQSTFNTVGGQLAIMLNCHSYNVTYSHRYWSFESALLDATMQIMQDEADNVLLGAFEINTPTLLHLMKRMKMNTENRKDGAYFFLLSSELNEHSLASIQIPTFNNLTNLDKYQCFNNIPKYEISPAAKLFYAIYNKHIPCALINTFKDKTSVIKLDLC